MPATKSRATTFTTSIDLEAATREAMVALCNQLLADSLDLYSQTKQAHWNVKGKDFFQLHALFDQLAANTLEYVDQIAERATALGGYATGTVRMSAANTTLPEFPENAVDGMEHVRALVERYAAYAASTRTGIDTASDAGDQSTADLLTEISRQVDKDLWFLEAHLQG
jgi:starvation-inducible DNA-binding protein